MIPATKREYANNAPDIDNVAGILSAALAGDEDAWRKIQVRYGEKMYGHIRVRARTDQDAQDILGDAWLRAYRGLPGYQSAVASLEAFFIQHVKWALADFYRRTSVRREMLFAELADAYPDARGDAELVDLLGAGASAAADDAGIPNEMYEALMRLTFAIPHPPHQAIAFGFCKLLNWQPRVIVSRRSEHRLGNMESELETEFIAETGLPAATVEENFEPLRATMNQLLRAVLMESRTRDLYAPLLNRQTGATQFMDFFTSKNPAADVEHWWHAVVRRVRSKISRGDLPETLREFVG